MSHLDAPADHLLSVCLGSDCQVSSQTLDVIYFALFGNTESYDRNLEENDWVNLWRLFLRLVESNEYPVLSAFFFVLFLF